MPSFGKSGYTPMWSLRKFNFSGILLGSSVAIIMRRIRIFQFTTGLVKSDLESEVCFVFITMTGMFKARADLKRLIR